MTWRPIHIFTYVHFNFHTFHYGNCTRPLFSLINQANGGGTPNAYRIHAILRIPRQSIYHHLLHSPATQSHRYKRASFLPWNSHFLWNVSSLLFYLVSHLQLEKYTKNHSNIITPVTNCHYCAVFLMQVSFRHLVHQRIHKFPKCTNDTRRTQSEILRYCEKYFFNKVIKGIKVLTMLVGFGPSVNSIYNWENTSEN